MSSESVIAIALIKRGIEEQNFIDPMKLQKLLYIAQGVYLAQNEEPLFQEKIEAWKFGPVVPSVYQAYKFYGSEKITDLKRLYDFLPSEQLEQEAEKLDSNVNDIIDKVWDTFKDTAPIKLSSWTHIDGSPWHRNYRPGVSGVVIPNEDIKEYFSGILNPHAPVADS
jgi:uncharacterized phage-associated protein